MSTVGFWVPWACLWPRVDEGLVPTITILTFPQHTFENMYLVTYTKGYTNIRKIVLYKFIPGGSLLKCRSSLEDRTRRFGLYWLSMYVQRNVYCP
jgi:hypothetical protein